MRTRLLSRYRRTIQTDETRILFRTSLFGRMGVNVRCFLQNIIKRSTSRRESSPFSSCHVTLTFRRSLTVCMVHLRPGATLTAFSRITFHFVLFLREKGQIARICRWHVLIRPIIRIYGLFSSIILGFVSYRFFSVFCLLCAASDAI